MIQKNDLIRLRQARDLLFKDSNDLFSAAVYILTDDLLKIAEAGDDCHIAKYDNLTFEVTPEQIYIYDNYSGKEVLDIRFKCTY